MKSLAAKDITRWTSASRASVLAIAACLPLLALGPVLFSANMVDKLTTLFIYIILAATWNALAGYGGLVSIGQQGFFGLGAYAAVRLAALGLPVYASLPMGAVLVAGLAWVISYFMLKLRDGEFGIGMWVLAELFHLLVNLDPLVQGETGTSLIALNAFDIASRRAD